jgi:hypothetical protein
MPSDDDTTPNASRREQRFRRRRIWHRSLIAGLAVALLAAGTAYAVTGPLQDDDRGGGRASRPAPTSAGAGTAAAQTCRAPLDPVDPLRLWIGGDSLAGSLGPSLGHRAGSTGVVQPVFDSRVSSGLLSPDFVNWPQHSADDMSLYNPEVTVFIVGANDAKNLPDGATRDPAWRAQYSALVEEMLAVIGGNGRAVYWVGAPVMADATYASTLSVPGGTVARVRGADGIHLTPEGGDLLAETVFERLDPACRITQQAVPGAVKATIEAPGSSSVPGSRRDAPTATTRSTTGNSRR